MPFFPTTLLFEFAGDGRIMCSGALLLFIPCEVYCTNLEISFKSSTSIWEWNSFVFLCNIPISAYHITYIKGGHFGMRHLENSVIKNHQLLKDIKYI